MKVLTKPLFEGTVLERAQFSADDNSVARCRSPRCRAVVLLEKGDMRWGCYDDGGFPYLEIDWKCPKCGQGTTLAQLGAPFLDSVEEMVEHVVSWQTHYRPSENLPFTRSSLEEILVQWRSSERYFQGDPTGKIDSIWLKVRKAALKKGVEIKVVRDLYAHYSGDDPLSVVDVAETLARAETVSH
jgi:ribosomal protein S27AE